MDCEVHASGYLRCCSQGDAANAQAHSDEFEDSQAYVKYLKMPKMLKLHLNGVGPTTEDVEVESWSDADFAADKADRKSMSGCVLTMDGVVIL